MKYAIICAMPEEFGLLGEMIEEKQVYNIYDRDFIAGKINGKEVVAVVSRIGKVAAAITTTILIDRFNVDSVLFFGIAGGLGGKISIGDIAIGTACVQHDFYLSENDIFRIPLLNVSSIPCDGELQKQCKNACVRFALTADKDDEIKKFFDEISISMPRIFSGVIASGDQFINNPEKKRWLEENIDDAICCEMEGAAVAQACYEAGVDFSIIRVISDTADENADISFDKFVNAASLYTCGIVKEFFS